MADTNRKAIQSEFIENLEAQRRELQAALDSLSNVLLGQGFVVLSGAGIALKFKVEGHQVTDPQTAGGPHLATRFTKQDAENIANSVTDGHGDHGQAVHINVALKMAIQSVDAVLVMVRNAV